MKTIGLIGAGNIGGTVARLAVAAGYDVIVSNSRGPETLTGLVAELGPRARAVVSVPLTAYASIPVEPLAGKVVIDTGNYYPGRDGNIPELEDGSTTNSEILQRHLPTTGVVKGFNNIFFKHLQALARPRGASDRTALPIAGDDAEAKALATEFLDGIGYDAVDVGPLSAGSAFGPGTRLYGAPYAGGDADFAASPGVPAGAETIRDLVTS